MKILSCAVSALLLGSGAASALTFDALATESVHLASLGEEPQVGNLWFESLLSTGTISEFRVTEPGRLTVNDDGTAQLTARTSDFDMPSDGFDIDMSFSDDVPDGSAYKNVFGRIPGVPSNIELWTITSGTLRGFGGWSSLEIGISQFPDPGGAATQIGGGTVGEGTANQHNENFGLSSWFAVDSVSYDGSACSLCGGLAENSVLLGSQGDIVFDLAESDVSNVTPIPLPAGISLSLAALGALAGLGFARRRT